MTHLFLKPMDVWLFRDGRPFEAGSAHRAESLFPPYPTTIQGAIRSHQLSLENIGFTDKEKIVEAIGTASDYKELSLRGPFLARINSNGEIERLYPQPADAIYDESDHRLIQAKIEEKIPAGVLTSAPVSALLGLHQKSGKQKSFFWLTETDLLNYLAGSKVQGIEKGKLYESEDRIGIGIEKSHNRVVEEGMLYEAEFIRLHENVGLLIEMSGYSETKWNQGGVLQLGGENRAAQYQSVKPVAWPKLPEAKRLLIYLATPAYFENGWQPKTWESYFNGSPKLVAAAINRYESLGGFDWAADPEKESAHRPSQRYVPAGSVYYLEGDSNLLPKQKALSDFGAEIGFGKFIAKEW